MNLTVWEIVELLEVSERTVHRWIEREGLPANHVHGAWKVHRAELFDWASAKGVQLPSRFFASRGGIDDVHDFARALRAGTVRRGLVGRARHDVAEALVASLTVPSPCERELVTEMVAARPGLGFVGVRDWIALPRLSDPVILDGPPAIDLCLFDEIPDEPEIVARVYFVAQAPTVHQHHHLVEDLYAALDDERFRQAALHGAPMTGIADTVEPAPPRADGSKAA